MRSVLVIFLLSFGVAAHAAGSSSSSAEHASTLKPANETQESYTPRVDKLELALRTHSRHALETLPNHLLAELRAGHAFTLTKVDGRENDEDAREYAIVVGNDREAISFAAYETLRGEVSQRQR